MFMTLRNDTLWDPNAYIKRHISRRGKLLNTFIGMVLTSIWNLSCGVTWDILG